MIEFKTRPSVLLYLLLVLAPLGVYWQVSHHGFIKFDDDLYVYENPQVKSGLTRDSLAWAFSFKGKEKTYWHPLTWISHMLDVHAYGMASGRHHLTNVLFHIANTLLLFIVLYRMTGHVWRSGLVAALFALHPLNVESVAWVAERKNVLSTFFWMLTLLMYSYYIERPRLRRYIAVPGVFVMGLLAKPMLVTLPFVLLLLDYWPLKRFTLDQPLRNRLATASGLILEKLPLLIFSGLSIYLSSASVQGAGSVKSFQSVTLSLRLANAVVSYIKYTAKAIWPQDLTVFYPYPESIPIWQVIGALIILIVITVGVFRALRQKPYLVVGWLWYLGTLVPVMGLIQVGLWPAMADRWAYVPLIGLFIMVAWWIPDFSQYRSGRVYNRKELVLLVLVVLTALMVSTGIRIGYWKNSMTLFQHALRVNPKNWVAHNNLGMALVDLDRNTEAYAHFSEALKLNPKSAHAHVNVGVEALGQGKISVAISHFQNALRLNYRFAEPHNNLGLALFRKGEFDAAIEHFQLAVSIKPHYADAHKNLNVAVSINQKLDQAVSNLREAIDFSALDPNLDDRLENLLKRKRELDQIINRLNKSLALQPGFNKLGNNDIPIVTETKKRYATALPLFREVNQLRPENASAYYHIACIYARQDLIPESMKYLDQAIQKGFNSWDIIENDSDLENIRRYDGYQRLVKGK